MANKILFIGYVSLMLMAVSCGKKGKESDSNAKEIVGSHHKTYESEAFSLSYPNTFFVKEELAQTGLQKIYICADSTDNDLTTILWEAPGTFPSNARDFVTIFASQEIDDFKKKGVFYDIMGMDSTFTIGGYPTYSINSIYTEGEDTIIQSRTGLILPNILDLMIVQRANTKKSMDEVILMTEILNSIRIKE
jgi:hypothetical protein